MGRDSVGRGGLRSGREVCKEMVVSFGSAAVDEVEFLEGAERC